MSWARLSPPAAAGAAAGADVTAGTSQAGAALGDLYGYSITLTGMEPVPANFITGSTSATNTFGSATNQPTIVYGTNS